MGAFEDLAPTIIESMLTWAYAEKSRVPPFSGVVLLTLSRRSQTLHE